MNKNFTRTISCGLEGLRFNKTWRKLLLLLAMLQLIAVASHAQSITVTGTVTDSKGEPLPGVSIKVKGTKIAASTASTGKYTIGVPSAAAVLEFTYVGYKMKEEAVGSRKIINVKLEEDANSLTEVVVSTGYGGTARKRDLTSATSTVTSAQIEERQPLNLFDALQGQAAGVLIVNDNGEPGAEGSITVRGPSTFSADGNGTNPLYVIDGVITPDASALNPKDILNIEVLKDAASSSIYGSRAANGVILITTKRGQEGPARFDLQYVFTAGKLAHKIQAPNSDDLRYYRKLMVGLTNGSGGTFTDSLNPSFNSDNDLQDLLLGNTGKKHDARLTISGGQKGLNYSGSFNYLDDQGIALNTYAKRIQSRINVDYQATKKLKYMSNISFYRQTGNFTSIGSSLRPVFDRPSYLRMYYPDGTLTSYLLSKRNPVANAMLEENTREEYKTQFVNTLNYQIIKDLVFTTALNAQLDNGQTFYFQPRYLSAQGNENIARNGTTKRFYYELQAYLNYSKTIGNHTFKALAAFSRDRRRLDETALEGKNFISENIRTITGANIVDLTKQRVSATAVSTASAIGRLEYNWKSKYILQGVFRNDASSRFGIDRRSGTFLAGSGAWRFTDESFMAWSKKFLDDGKLRFSYGSAGNDPIADYESIPRIEIGENSYNGIGGAALTAGFSNSTIKWENTVIKNWGADLTFLKGRLGLSADYYIKTTNDLLYDRQIPKETGFNTVKINVGNIENKGLELAMNGTPIAGKDFKWTVNANVSFERGRILKLYDGQEFIAGNKHLIREGGRIGDFYGWKNLGVYPYDASNAYAPDGRKLTPINVTVVTTGSTGRAATSTAERYELDGQPYGGQVLKKSSNNSVLLGGDTEWEDINNDGVINDADRHVIGNAQPDAYLGFVNNFSYKNYSLSFIINTTIGGQVYNSFKQGLTNFANNGNPSLPEAIYGAWTKQGDIATYPYYPDKDTRGSQRQNGNSYFLEDATFLRLSSARFSYRLDSKYAGKIGARSVMAYVYGVNLLTYTNYTGYDPEFSSPGLTPGDDNGKYPKRREIGFGINIGF
ncbi:TonB-dependent receptor [Pedobacter heparinus]|uniref:SusC/RagA family TonB-linked outer membrane protein n=1 Tax=Pedobacter heparinus TaxID=984 RepID=UPI00292E7FAC|nr:TonB-dependent receptor [Pedobacter heparinus]